jgi:hypothetical protein
MSHEFLKYGAISLSFLLAFLSFKLLNKEQEKKSPNKTTIYSIYIFMIFSLLLSMSSFYLDFFKENNSAKIQLNSTNNNTEIVELKAKLKYAQKNLNNMLNAKSGFLFQLELSKPQDKELFDKILNNIKELDKTIRDALKD